MTVSEILLCAILFVLTVMAVTAISVVLFKNCKRAKIEGKFFFESKRITWRVVNTGGRDIVIVEIGIMCHDKVTGYRPLFSQTEDINNIPHRIARGEIASYRKEMERFTFKQSEIEELKISNPYVSFYAKDAEGKVYKEVSDIKFAQFLTESTK